MGILRSIVSLVAEDVVITTASGIVDKATTAYHHIVDNPGSDINNILLKLDKVKLGRAYYSVSDFSGETIYKIHGHWNPPFCKLTVSPPFGKQVACVYSIETGQKSILASKRKRVDYVLQVMGNCVGKLCTSHDSSLWNHYDLHMSDWTLVVDPMKLNFAVKDNSGNRIIKVSNRLPHISYVIHCADVQDELTAICITLSIIANTSHLRSRKLL